MTLRRIKRTTIPNIKSAGRAPVCDALLFSPLVVN